MNIPTHTAKKLRIAIKSSHHRLLLAGLLAVGIVASVSVFASGPREILVTSPGVNATVSKDFEIKARVTAKEDRPAANVMLTIDQGTATQFIAASYTGEFKKGVAKDVYFSAGKNRDQSNERLYNIDLLPPGKHTITAVIRNGDKPGQGDVISSADISFNVRNENAVATTGEKVTVKPNKPGEAPITTRSDSRVKDRKQTLRQPAKTGAEKTKKAESGTTSYLENVGSTLTSFFNPTVEAASNRGTIHITTYIDESPNSPDFMKDRRIGNVSVTAEQLENPSYKCDDTQHSSTKLPNGHYVIGGKTDATQGANHGEIHFDGCPTGTYRITYQVPPGYDAYNVGADYGNVKNENIGGLNSITFNTKAGTDNNVNFYFIKESTVDSTPPQTTTPTQPPQQQPTTNQAPVAPTQTVGAQACTPTPATRVPIYRWQYTAGADPSYDNMYSQDPNNSPGNGWVRVPDEPVFYLYPTQQAGTLPFRQFVNGFHHFYAFTDNLSAGTFEVIIGYGIPASGSQVSDDVALYHSWANNINPYTGEVGAHYYTIDYNRYVDSFNRGYTNFDVGPFADTGTTGFVWNTDGSGQVCVPDDTAPQVTITSIAGDGITIDAQAGIVGGVNGTLTSVSVSVDGATVYTGNPGAGSLSSYPIAFPTPLSGGTTHNITVTVTNNGNLSSSASTSYTPPTQVYDMTVFVGEQDANGNILRGISGVAVTATSDASGGGGTATTGSDGKAVITVPAGAATASITVPTGFDYVTRAADGTLTRSVGPGGTATIATTSGPNSATEQTIFGLMPTAGNPTPSTQPTARATATPNPNGGNNPNYNGVPQNDGVGRAVTTFKDLPATGQASLFTIATILVFAALYYGSSYIAKKRRKS